MDVRIVVDGKARHFTTNLAHARRFVARYGGTVERSVFGQWVEDVIHNSVEDVIARLKATAPFATNPNIQLGYGQ